MVLRGSAQNPAPDGASGKGEGRELPAHIRAQLASAGRTTDTAGQPWKGRNLGEGSSHKHQFAQDSGQTEPQVEQELGRFIRGQAAEEDLVRVLGQSRVFAPILAAVSHSVITEQGLVADKESEMALVSIKAPDGRKALPVFTCVAALTSWHEQARPVAAQLRRAALAAVEDENQLIVVNPGQDFTFVVRRPAVWAIAQGKKWLPSYKDPLILEALNRFARQVEPIKKVEIAAGDGVASATRSGMKVKGGGPGPELKIMLKLLPGLTREQLQEALAAFQELLAGSTLVAERVDSVQLALLRQ